MMFIVLILLSNAFAGNGMDWIVTTYDDSTNKERRFRLKEISQLVPLRGYEWRCLFPPEQVELDGRVLIRSVQCSVLGSGRMVGGVANCVTSAPTQLGSLNLVLHEGMNTKSNKFEYASDHKSIAITLECVPKKSERNVSSKSSKP